MPMHTPPHPGGIVKDVITDLDLTVTDAAAVLNVSRPTLSSVINGRAGISPEMAVRLSKAFGSTTGFWLRLQMNYDLAEVERRAATIVVNPLPASVATASPAEGGR